ncbi:MAG: hypothetical protein JRN15_01805 [Nitrososphaerota archaeon]|nr:hypothetical protein [Nitrososphaerota archaeon]
MKGSLQEDGALRDNVSSSSDGFANQQMEDERKLPDSRSHNSGRVISYLRSHPKLCLLLLTPGIVEYLLGSSLSIYMILLETLVYRGRYRLIDASWSELSSQP